MVGVVDEEEEKEEEEEAAQGFLPPAPLALGILDIVLRGPLYVAVLPSVSACCLRSSLGFTVDTCSYNSLLALGNSWYFYAMVGRGS